MHTDSHQGPTHTINSTSMDATSQLAASFESKEKLEIDLENRRRLAEMSPRQIEEERAELMAGLPPSLLERMLRRANIDDNADDTGRATTELPVPPSEPIERPSLPSSDSTKDTKKVAFALPEEPTEAYATETLPPKPEISRPQMSQDDVHPEDAPPPTLPITSPASEPEFPYNSIHFPTAPSQKEAPNLDPNSATFLEDLHRHYFPNLPYDPSSLAWLQPVSDEEVASSPYSPDLASLPPSSLRFSFTGTLIPPNAAREIPVTQGLHHHGAAPEAAGYTVGELALLSRSTVPSQRSVAWQVLGRLMYRLGKGQFGGKGHELSEGIWGVVEKEKVLDRMIHEAGEGRHASAKAWAVEGVWLWRMGGAERGLGERVKAQ